MLDGALRLELRRKRAHEGVVFLRPAKLHHLEHHLRLLRFLGDSGAPVPASRVGAVQDEVAHPLRLPSDELDRNGSALADADNGKAIQAYRIDDGTEIANPTFERQVVDVTVREPASSRVVADQTVARRQCLEPRAPRNALPLILEMRQPAR